MRDVSLDIVPRVPPGGSPPEVTMGGAAGGARVALQAEGRGVRAVGAAHVPAPKGSPGSAQTVATKLSEGFLERSEWFKKRQESGEAYRRSKNPYRVQARRRGYRRERERNQGLSNTTYLAASSGAQKLTVTLTPARAKFTISDPVADLESSSRPGGGRRGVVCKFSDGARDRLADRAAELQAMKKEPQFMGTFTAPANWEEVYLYDKDGVMLEGGRIFKQHLEALRKRLDRKLQKLGIHHWGALWFLEFQERGAPHVHLIVFDCVIDGKKRKALRSWAGRAWASIMNNPSKVEKEKHIRAGTQISKMKKKHFGYALKYASKMDQKTVPEEFYGVGRFWGVWNCKREAPVVVELEFSRLNAEDRDFIHNLAVKVLAQVYQHSRKFFESRAERVYNALHKGIKHKTGFSVYGESASQTAKTLLSA